MLQRSLSDAPIDTSNMLAGGSQHLQPMIDILSVTAEQGVPHGSGWGEFTNDLRAHRPR